MMRLTLEWLDENGTVYWATTVSDLQDSKTYLERYRSMVIAVIKSNDEMNDEAIAEGEEKV